MCCPCCIISSATAAGNNNAKHHPLLLPYALLVGKKTRVELLWFLAGQSTGRVLLTTTTYNTSAPKEPLVAIDCVFGSASSGLGAAASLTDDAIINDNVDKGEGFIHKVGDYQAYLLMGLVEDVIARDLGVNFKAMCDIFGAKVGEGGTTSTSGHSLGGS